MSAELTRRSAAELAAAIADGELSSMEVVEAHLDRITEVDTEVHTGVPDDAVDLFTDKYQPLAKHAKDTAAGAVLIGAIGAAIAGCIIFLPKLWTLVRSWL